MVQITISNNIRIRGASVMLRAAITSALTVDNPEYKKRKARRQRTWGCDPKLKLYSEEGADLIVPRGFKSGLITIIKSSRVAVEFTHDTTAGYYVDFGEWNPKYEIREAQRPCVDAIVNRCGCLIAPAGSGKTVMGLRAIYENQVPALWITHTIDLLRQTTKSAYGCMPDIGKIGKIAEGVCDYGDGKLIVATVQTLQSRPDVVEYLNKFVGTLVTDECHHVPSVTFLDVIGKFKAMNVLGLTASPDRKDGLECYMYAAIGPKLYEIDRAGLYESNRLIKPEIKFVYTDFSFDQASVRNEINSVDAGGEQLDYRELLDKLIDDEARLELIAKNILDQKGYQIVISDSIPYCHKIYDKIVQLCTNLQVKVPRMKVVHGPLQRYGWKVIKSEFQGLQMMQDGKANAVRYDKKAKRWKAQVPNYTDYEYRDWNISASERKTIMQDAADRKIDILIATGQLVQEGLDLPHLNHGHLVTPKRGDSNGANNGAAVEQAIGRIMRVDPKVPDKEAVWWDYVDYNNGVLKAQYNSRRKVYERLQLSVPKKSRTKGQDIEKFLNSIQW